MIAAGLAAFTPSWASSHSKYDPAAEVDLKRAKEIFPLDFVQCFLKILAEKTTPKVARLTIKELAKKNGGREGLHDLFLDNDLVWWPVIIYDNFLLNNNFFDDLD